MKFVAKDLGPKNVNISNVSPIKYFFSRIFVIFVAIAIIYLLGIAIVEMLLLFIPNELNSLLGSYNADKFFEASQTTKNEPFDSDTILKKLLDNADLNDDYKITIIDSPTVNALAYPGNRIVLYTGLLKKINSEEELAFVLAHELGHYFHNDHIRAMGRGVVLMTLMAVLSGHTGSQIPGAMLQLMDLRYSRNQEKKADLYAIDLLAKTYGNVSGALTFIEKMDKYAILDKLAFLNTHPAWEYRKKTIQSMSKEKGYIIGM